MAVCNKGHQRLYCLRKLSRFNIDKTMMTLFYRAFIESILSFALVSWFASLTVKNKNSLNQIVNWASKLIGGESQQNLATLYSSQLQRKADTVSQDCSHPLHGEFQILHSGCRFLAPKRQSKRYANTFIPAAISSISSLNQNRTRSSSCTNLDTPLDSD